MSIMSKLAAAALATIVVTGAFTGSTQQARAAKLSPAVGVGIALGVGLLAGAALANQASKASRAYPFRSREWHDDESSERSFSRRKTAKRCWGRTTFVPEMGKCIDLEAQDDNPGERNGTAHRKDFRTKSSLGKGCPRGQYRNQNGVCQPNETGG